MFKGEQKSSIRVTDPIGYGWMIIRKVKVEYIGPPNKHGYRKHKFVDDGLDTAFVTSKHVTYPQRGFPLDHTIERYNKAKETNKRHWWMGELPAPKNYYRMNSSFLPSCGTEPTKEEIDKFREELMKSLKSKGIEMPKSK